jgi:hypothetical protein
MDIKWRKKECFSWFVYSLKQYRLVWVYLKGNMAAFSCPWAKKSEKRLIIL